MKREDRQIHRDVARHFSAAAGNYDAGADMQRHAAERLLGLLPGGDPGLVLDLGCGTGVLTERMLARWPRAQITAVDVAPGMIAEIKKRLPRVHAYVADIACLVRNPVFDLVASNCALHWLSPFADGMQRTAEQVAPGGLAAISLMLDGTLCELHEARREAAPDKAAANRMPDVPRTMEALARSGLRVLTHSAEDFKVTLNSPRDVLESVRAQGLTGGHLARGRQPLTRGELQRLERAYAGRFPPGAGVTATYRIGYFVAVKPA